MNAISDPGRPRRRDRRRAQKLVDTAFAERRLTAADRALRTQRIQAAHTRGDLATITRDLVAPVQTNLGRALDASGGTSRWHAGTGQRGTMSSMRVGSTASQSRTPGLPATLRPGTPTIDLSGVGRRIRLFVLIAIAGVFLSCVLGLVAFIAPVVREFQSDVAPSAPGTTVPTPGQARSEVVEADAASLHTAAGWTALVAAIKAESGTADVYDLVVYPGYASVGLDGKDAIERRLFRNGDWQEGFSARTPIHGALVDLSDIDPKTIARLLEQTAQQVEIDDPTGAYLIVNAFTRGPQIAVYVQSNGESQYRTYRLDGTAIS